MKTMLGKGFVDRYVRLSREKDSFLCVGVDPATSDMRSKNVVPPALIREKGLKEGVKEFCLHLIEAVAPYTPVIKPNAQFLLYLMGYGDMKEIVDAIHAGGCLALLDIKLSDIGSTMDAGLYWIDRLGFDAATFSPFPGYENGVDAVYRWAGERDKGIFALCRMSNPGTHDYQSRLMDGEPFYRRLARDAYNRGSNGYVVGCTASEELGEVRSIIGEECLILAPGLGTQGGDPVTALRLGANKDGERLIVSSTRSIDFAYESLGWDRRRYPEAAAKFAEEKRDELNDIRRRLVR
ncbi:orotidine-5'-phosphate decarboxylase [Candidatus Bathyarchaeota archaeon]|nr:orotidine-5'-phosphate decarboxylase [Candidatus Bathyarchaeota archaeon]